MQTRGAQLRTLRRPIAGTLILALLAGSAMSVSAQTDDTSTDPMSGTLLYGDPDGRFTLPLIGDWTVVETDGSHARFSLADPALELYVVSTAADAAAGSAGAALGEIGLDAEALTLVQEDPHPSEFPGWSVQVFARDDGQLVGALSRELDGTDVTIVGIGALSDFLSAKTILTVGGFAELPMAEYLARAEERVMTAPTSVADIEDLNSVEFYSGGTELVGRLHLPDGEGPFPAVVGTHGSGRGTRWAGEYVPVSFLVDAGFAVFNYDKRGVDDSEGVFVEVGAETGHWRLPQLADDALAAVTLLGSLDEIDADRIGLMGGSQAGWVNPLAASRSDDLAFVVSVVGPTVTVGEEIFYSDLTGGSPRLPSEMTEAQQRELSGRLAAFDGPRGFDPRPAIEAMTAPGLWVWGEHDGSIPYPESRAILEDVISEQGKDFAILSYPGKGHHIGHAVYQDDVIDWIAAQFEG